MGHHQLYGLPRTPALKRVVLMLGNGAGAPGATGIGPGTLEDIAEATLQATNKGLDRAKADEGLAYCLYLMTTLTRAATQGDFAAALSDAGLPSPPASALAATDTAAPGDLAHPARSLGADLARKGYVDYLIARYFEFRHAEGSYGIRRPFSHEEIHKTIQREFGHKTFFMPVKFFDRLAQFLYRRIDETVMGRNNHSRGATNYHTFQEHLADQSA